MSLNIGIVGLPNVGKSTLFQALTKKNVDRSNYPFATIDPNVGVVQVPDERLWKLSSLSKSKKTIPAIVEFVDIAGLVKGAAEGEGLGNKFLTHIKEVDAILEVVRIFEDPNIIHVSGNVDPHSDIEIIETELILKDLETAESTLARFERETKNGDKKKIEKFEKLKKLVENLKSGRMTPSNKESLDLPEELQLLSAKPILYCFNFKEGALIPKNLPQNSILVDLQKEFEVSELSEKDRIELGEEQKLPILIKKAYELLDLITFFTTGEDETRAWTIPKNSKAPRAGRAIHSDFEEKFIRAEVIFWGKLMEIGSWSKARELGQLRIEGKEYIVKDGDVIEFRI